MNLAALTIGEAVPAEFDAVVHSVFRSAVNLRWDAGDGLLTLVTSDETDLPQGIRVDTPPDFSFETLHPADPASCRDGFLHLASLKIDLRPASRWTCNLPALRTDLTDPKTTAAWRTVWQALNARQIQTQADLVAEEVLNAARDSNLRRSSVSSIAASSLHSLTLAARRLDAAALPPPLIALIGLGAGLTPSGDDLLAGFLAGLWCTALERKERLEFLSKLGQAVIALSSRTNDISRTYLLHAAHGKVSRRLLELAQVISRGENDERLLAAADIAMQAGHTSGMDTVTGLLGGMNVWEASILKTTH
ncbi:MAG: DUF2877 domain-containing protein [Chloroflexota bacterium]